MLDSEGNIADSQDQLRLVIDDLPDSYMDVSISAVESRYIDSLIDQVDQVREEDMSKTSGLMENFVSSIYGEPEILCEKLHERQEERNFACSIGVTTASQRAFLVNPIGRDDSFDDTDEVYVSDDERSIDLDAANLDDIFVSAFGTGIKTDVDAKHLSKVWRIDLDSAQRTLDVTTQQQMHTPNASFTRNFSTSDWRLRYKRIKEFFFMDTFFATKKAKKSSRGNTCVQLFVTDKGFVYVVPMKSKADVLKAVKQFAKEIGAPDAIICDHSGEQSSHALRQFLSEIDTGLRILEANTPWSNRAELYIGLLKAATGKDMKESDCPLAFWDYCVERRARINNMTAKDLFQLHGTNAHTATLFEEGDISNLCRFGWYEWCYYREERNGFPLNKEVLGRVLGPASGEGNEMAQWILKSNGKVVPHRTIRPLRPDEIRSETEKRKRDLLDQLIAQRWGMYICPPPDVDSDPSPDKVHDQYEPDMPNDKPQQMIFKI